MFNDASLTEFDPCWSGRFGGRRMLFLPGGHWQVPVIRLAQHMGFEVICADGTPNAPAFAVADEAIHVPLQDIDALVAIGKSRRVDAVMTEQTDFAVPIVARVAAALGLRGLPIAVADAATNKGLMRQKAAEAGLRQPAFRVCRTVEEACRTVADIGVPLFCKPVDGQSSRGVGRLDQKDAAAVQRAFQRAASASRVGETIFEQHIDGIECTVEGFVVAGRPTTLAISDKEHYEDSRWRRPHSHLAGRVLARRDGSHRPCQRGGRACHRNPLRDYACGVSRRR